MLTKCAALDLGEHKIRVNSVSPAYVGHFFLSQSFACVSMFTCKNIHLFVFWGLGLGFGLGFTLAIILVSIYTHVLISIMF